MVCLHAVRVPAERLPAFHFGIHVHVFLETKNKRNISPLIDAFSDRGVARFWLVLI